MRHILVAAALGLSACWGAEPPPPTTGISPGDPVPASPEAARPLVLEAPAEIPSAPADAVPPPTVAAARTVFEVDPLGRFEVVTWEEAARRAEARITAGNLQTEVNRLRVEILGRRR